MPDRYAVFGNPIAHSKSPQIHAEFARLTNQDLTYERLLAPLDGFAAAVHAERARGLCGCNVTLPFKTEAFGLATLHTNRAALAGAVNTLKFEGDEIIGDNTDGAGLVADLVGNLGIELGGKRILILGAGGATLGVMQPLLASRPEALVIANRTVSRARDLARGFAPVAAKYAVKTLTGCGFSGIAGDFQVVINATSAALKGDALPVSAQIFAKDAIAFDMVYGQPDSAFFALANSAGARTRDGLGMLIEQAAESFLTWRGVRPPTASLFCLLQAK